MTRRQIAFAIFTSQMQREQASCDRSQATAKSRS
jgi:hypothetical protein